MNFRRLLNIVAIGLSCISFYGCSDDVKERNQRLFDRVNASFVQDAKAKSKYRYVVGIGSVTEKERVGIVCQCAEVHLQELKRILEDYQPEVRCRRGPYRMSQLVFSADSSLLFELRGLIRSYEELVEQIKGNEVITLEVVHGLVDSLNQHKHNFYQRARILHLKVGGVQ